VVDTTTTGLKTTYDPAIWTDTRLIQSATEALANAKANVGTNFFNDPVTGLDMWKGVDAAGFEIRGHYKGTPPNIQITTFWPV
jgi:hypothetical protein